MGSHTERPSSLRLCRLAALAALSEREREVLALMAEGRSNAGIARRMRVTEGTVDKHVRSILQKLNLPETEEDHRRVLAVVTSLVGPSAPIATTDRVTATR